MDTDYFIQALRRFVARGGAIRFIRTDDGTNFVEVSNKLKKALDKMDQKQNRQHLLKSGKDWVKWLRNPLGASHMGGIWERQIPSARTIFEALLKTLSSILNDENLRIIILETNPIINSRPLRVETLSVLTARCFITKSASHYGQ